MAKNDQAAKADMKPDATAEQPKPGDPASALAAEVFSAAPASPGQVKPADAQPPASTPATVKAPPSLEDIGKSDPVMAALLKQLDDMRAEIAALKNPVATPTAPAEVREFTADALAMKSPRKFKVSLPHVPDGVVAIDTAGVREIDWKDHAIAAYVKAMGIVVGPNGRPNTEHQFTCIEIDPPTV